tara:strand:- start:467 stop:2296 length:1830 start_codon:yes stop_codon:yes gene_type:complete
MKAIIGISAFYHDSAAALIIDGNIVAAAQEERFTRIKHDSDFPINSINYILAEANLRLSDIDAVIFYDKPLLKFERLLETYVSFAPKGLISFIKAMPIVLREKLFLKYLLLKKFRLIKKNFSADKIFFSEHHLSHAASAFYPSPFKDAIILTMDGVGEWTTASIAIGSGNKIKIVKEMQFPHSLGLLYSAFTYYLGFKVNSGEYKVMGLAPYGNPKYTDIIVNDLIDLKIDGSFRLKMKFFNFATGLTMINSSFAKLFGEPIRNEEDKLNQFHMDIAASIQKATETILLKITKDIHDEYKIDNLCLAGGVALNCVANGKMLREKRFKDIWVQPAAGDAGGALGAALLMWYDQNDNQRIVDKNDSMQGAYLGPSYSNDQIEIYLRNLNAVYQFHSDDELTDTISVELSNGMIIGWFQGRMEFGPRALGSRSILANPMISDMQKKLNLKIKFRESFRPFAPAVLYENVSDWFELDKKSPYMQFVSQIKKDKIINTENDQKLFGIEQLNLIRSQIPCVTHVDHSARIQTVHKETNPRFHSLIKKFDRLTNCPVLSNTSFNIRGEPIVNTPEDAYRCFMGTDLDILVIGNYILHKSKQVNKINKNFKNEFKSD